MLNSNQVRGLVEAAQSDDPVAIDALIQYCQPDVQRFDTKVCTTPEDIEDAVQETLWIIYQKIGTLRTAAVFATWLFRVVKHECFRLLRERPMEVVCSVPLGEEGDLLWPQATVLTELTDLQRDRHAISLHDLNAAIALLPPKYRDVLLLRDVEELSAPEVAARLGISVEAVKSRLHRARARVRETLTDGE